MEEKNELNVKKEIKIISKWELLISDEDQINRVKKLNLIEQKIPTTILEYDELMSEIKKLQTELNKFDKENIKPIKQSVLAIKDEIIGGYQNQTINRIKLLKKQKELEAIEAGIIFPKLTQPIAEVRKNKVDEIKLKVQNKISKLEDLNKPTKKDLDWIIFLKEILYDLNELR